MFTGGLLPLGAVLAGGCKDQGDKPSPCFLSSRKTDLTQSVVTTCDKVDDGEVQGALNEFTKDELRD